jgi:cysteine desulfurase/selenocysteine lyase
MREGVVQMITSRSTDRQGFDPVSIKADFPILNREINGRRLVYLDNAATTQKPITVIEATRRFYTRYNANVHRGLHTLAEEATAALEAARRGVAAFIGGVKTEEVIFTRGATESINLVAYAWGQHNVKAGDRIVLTQMEHHANLVPWIALAKRTGAELAYIPIDDNGYLVLDRLSEIISSKTKLVAVTHMSNVLGTINPIETIIEAAHARRALALIDAAQSMPHMPVDVRSLGADFVAFSAHKMLGPTGIGVLYGKESILADMEPFNYGGEMIGEVTYDHADWASLPWKFEAGTPNIAGAAAFTPALDYLEKLGMDNVRQHEHELTEYAIERLSLLDSIRILGPLNADHRGGAISFVDKDVHPHDLSQILDQHGVAIRAGHHCAQPLHRRLGLVSSARASFYVYNARGDVDQLVYALKEARGYFGHE